MCKYKTEWPFLMYTIVLGAYFHVIFRILGLLYKAMQLSTLYIFKIGPE